MEVLQNKLEQYVNNPLDYSINYKLGLEYEKLNQGAAALSYFLRCAELCYEIDSDLAYECILKTWLQVHRTGRRPVFEQEQLMTALTFKPERPEAYYLLSVWHTDRREWKPGYMYATLGCQANHNLPPLKSDVSYRGIHSNTFQKAFSSWWCGQREQSRNLFKELYSIEDLDPYFLKPTITNLIREDIIKVNHTPLTYKKKDYNNLNPNIKFKGLKNIEQNYSQVFQDLFVLTCLDGKKDGTYLEIGAGDPIYGNNTYLLSQLGWEGISIDLDPEQISKWKLKRQTDKCFCLNSLKINYSQLLKENNLPNKIDYLQIDVDPVSNTYKTLLKIPFDKIEFSVITFEHDYYVDETRSYRNLSRKYLQEKGYELVISNVSPDDNTPFEDWYLNPKYVDENTIKQLKTKDNQITNINNYICGNTKEKK